MKKRGLSAVVTTVLLVLISFLAIGIVWAFILPMIKNNIEQGGSCFELREHAKIASSDYTCYTSGNTYVMIERAMENLTISGFRISVTAGSNSEVYDLIDGKTAGNVKMYDNSQIIKIPEPGEARTYNLSIKEGSKVKLGVITKSGKVCEVDSVDIPSCK